MMFKPYPKQHQITIYQSVIFRVFSHIVHQPILEPPHSTLNPVTSSTSALTGIPVTFTWNRHQEVVPRICSGLPQELLREFPCRDDKNHFCLHIVNIIYMYIPRCVPCLFFSGWVVTTDLFLPGSSTWRKMRFTTLTSNKKMGWCTTPKFNLEPGNWFFSKFRSSPFPRCWFFRWSMYTLED